MGCWAVGAFRRGLRSLFLNKGCGKLVVIFPVPFRLQVRLNLWAGNGCSGYQPPSPGLQGTRRGPRRPSRDLTVPRRSSLSQEVLAVPSDVLVPMKVLPQGSFAPMFLFYDSPSGSHRSCRGSGLVLWAVKLSLSPVLDQGYRQPSPGTSLSHSFTSNVFRSLSFFPPQDKQH